MPMRFFFVLLLILNGAVCSAEDLKFIDSNGDTGYFVDADSVRAESMAVFSANLVIIRIDSNQMDVVNLKINHAAKTYAIRSTRTLAYDSRAELSADLTSRPPRNYTDESLMGDLVKIILHGGD